MKCKRILILLLVLVLLFSSTGCNNKIENNTMQSTNNPMEEKDRVYEPEYGGKLILPLTTLNTLNPLLSENLFYHHFSKLIFEGLFDFDDNLDIIPVLANSYRIEDNGKTINIKLKEDVKWHDGEKFTAEDVAFTINTIKYASGDTVYKKMLNNSIGIYNPTNISRIINVQILSPYELNIIFDRNFSHGLETLTFPIIPRHKFVIDKENNKAYALALAEEYIPIGTGPYKFEDYEKFKRVRLSSFPEYRNGKAYIDTIIGKVLENENLILTAFETGQLHLAIPLDVDWGKYNQNSRIRTYEFVGNNYEFLGINFKSGIFAGDNSKSIRKAIAYGIDRQKIIQNIYLGHGTQVEAPIYPDSWLIWEDANIYGYNPNKAREELEKIGWKDINGDGFYENENGEELVIRLLTNPDNLLRTKTADMIIGDLDKIGIKVEKDYPELTQDNLNEEIIESQWEEVNRKLINKDFDMVLLGWHLSTIPDLSFAFHSSQIRTGTNFINYKDEKMDEILFETFNAGDRNKKLESYKKLQSHIVEELPYISLFFKNNALLVDRIVKGDINPSFFNYYRNIEKWYIPKEFQQGDIE